VLGWAVIAVRLLVLAATLVFFGATAFFSYGLAPRGLPFANRQIRWPRVLALIAAGSALFASLLWLVLEAATLGGSSADAMNTGELWLLITQTHFGQIGAFRCVLLVFILAMLAALGFHRRRLWAMHSLLAAVVWGSLAWTGHGHMNSGIPGWVHLGGDLMHLLTAGLWIGALVPLCVLVMSSQRRDGAWSEREIAYALTRFSAIAVPVVAVLLLSGIINSWFLIGPAVWRSPLTTLYGRLLFVKLALFVLMLALAAINRVRLTPGLQRAAALQSNAGVLPVLRATILAETTLAMLVLGLVAMIGTLEPPIGAN
jgi:putative copper resistance protein D